ncbi:MAG: hypothetical protein J2P45_02325, partial [Candidatus Dormibacteraeota bacterium]|nr:hypothetical protein [Candidatus Dormibacteraeota bacterium]
MNQTLIRGLAPAATVGAILLAAATACGGGTSSASTPKPSASASSSSPAGPSQYLTADQAAKSATLKLNITGFNFDGYRQGQMVVNVPQGWKVTVDCSNKTSVAHSCAIAAPNATTPAFPGASSPNPTAGLQPGDAATFTFTADQVGAYRIACLVPGHESGGMWDT